MKSKVILVVLALCVTGCLPEVWVDVSPNRKALLISDVRDGREGVFWVPLDGKQVKRLADIGWNAKLSPDGRYCVFMSDKPDSESKEQMRLLLYDFAEETHKVLGSWPKKEGLFILPSWKPDGKEIAYVLWWWVEGSGGSGETELRIINLATQSDRKISEGVALFCNWSPDGKRLAFHKCEVEGHRLPNKQPLGSLQITEGRRTKGVAGVLLDLFADITWLSDERILFASPKISLPCSEREKDHFEEAVFVYDLTTGTVAPIYETTGILSFACGLRLSPDRRRFLFGTEGSASDEVKLWCYDFSSSTKTKLAGSIPHIYPFWITNSQVGYFESEDRIVIVDIDEKLEPVVKQTLDLSKLLAPLRLPKEEPLTPAPQPTKQG